MRCRTTSHAYVLKKPEETQRNALQQDPPRAVLLATNRVLIKPARSLPWTRLVLVDALLTPRSTMAV